MATRGEVATGLSIASPAARKSISLRAWNLSRLLAGLLSLADARTKFICSHISCFAKEVRSFQYIL
jgi:hypothetical protein